MIEKILERLETQTEKYSATTNDYAEGLYDGYDGAIQIVQEVAKEYGNGWIPCSERLPGEEETKDCASFLVTKRIRNKFTIIDMCLFGTEGEWLVRENEEVLAWQKIAPYQKGE